MKPLREYKCLVSDTVIKLMELMCFRQGNNTDEEAAQAFLEQYNALYADLANKYVLADWTYNTNLTDENADAAV